MTKPLLTGVLKTWKEDRGFGFISPDNGGRDVFIHISAIGETNRRPVPGDLIQYQIVRDRNGKFRAINASIEGVSTGRKSAYSPKSNFRWGIVGAVCLLIIATGAVFLYLRKSGFI